jgi:hypothetical protein
MTLLVIADVCVRVHFSFHKINDLKFITANAGPFEALLSYLI